MTYLYFVGQFVNQYKHPQARPILLRKVAWHLTLEEAEDITTRRNVEAGHVCDDVELMLSSPNAQYFMYDEEPPVKNSESYERDRKLCMDQDSDKDYRLGNNR